MSRPSDEEAETPPSRWTVWRLKKRRLEENTASDDSMEQDDSASEDRSDESEVEQDFSETSDEPEGTTGDAAPHTEPIVSDEPEGTIGDVAPHTEPTVSDENESQQSDDGDGYSDNHLSHSSEVENAARDVNPQNLTDSPAYQPAFQLDIPHIEENNENDDTLSNEDEAAIDDQDEEGRDDEAQNDSEGVDSSDNEDGNEEHEILYPNARLTVFESLLSVMTVALKHRLNGKCVADILELIELHCPPNNNCVTTLYKLKKYFSMIGSSALNLHYYCSGCVIGLDDKTSVCPECNGASEVNFFIENPIKNQILTLMKRPNFFDDLQYRFNRTKKSNSNVEDLYDGEIYKALFEQNGFLSNPNNISLFWYTDGIPIYHTSKFQLWPLYFRVNELSPSKRYLRENTILGGLWFGPKKVNPNVFLRPFHTALREFENYGYDIQLPDGSTICMKGKLLLGVGDLPALSSILRFRQFNGAFGCLNCESEGERHVAGGGTVQVYPYTPNIVLRNNDEIPRLAEEALRLRQLGDANSAVKGVKGPSLLYNMVPNMIRCTGKDKMHGVDGGVGKQVLILMTDSVYSDEPFSIRNVIRNVDNRLTKIKPPSYVQRVPCSIENDFSLWHSQDHRHWLMYYSVPILLGLQENVYLEHQCLLISAVFLLDQLSISVEQIAAASQMLHLYVSRYQELYGLRHLGINVHQLLHLPDTVRDLGPLWICSCYSFEDLNGQLKRLIHGTRHAGMQLCSAASMYMHHPVMVQALPEESIAKQFCQKFEHRGACSVKVADEISPGVYAVGKYFTANEHDEIGTVEALRQLRVEGGRIKCFHRLRKHGIMFYSCNYPRQIQKESSYVEFTHDNVPKLGRIQCFFRWSNCNLNCPPNCQQCPALYFFKASEYESVPWFIHRIPLVRLPYLHKVQPKNEMVLLPVSALTCLCFYVCVENDEYIIQPINLIEGN